MNILTVILKTESPWDLFIALGILFAIIYLPVKAWSSWSLKNDEKKAKRIKHINDYRSSLYNQYKQYTISKKDYNEIKTNSDFPNEIERMIKGINREIGIKKKEINQFDSNDKTMFPEDVRHYISKDDLLHMKEEAEHDLKTLRSVRQSLTQLVKIYENDRKSL